MISYLSDATQFQLSFNRDSGRAILYGLDHVAIRQQCLSELSKPLKCAFVKQKIQYFQLNEALNRFASWCDVTKLENVFDVGMGHSIYHLDFQEGSVILRKKYR